ncbi:MAG: hypothetical protein SWE60_20635 [Thermodesulfobacteriota bacterium]|nr:hypothetical protein [Thermodesulfobacteriota bacterium]
MTGYKHFKYTESLAEFGAPRELQRSGAWILERRIPGARDKDAMGCYPLFLCEDWTRLHGDLEDVGSELVSLALVTDPFGNYDIDYLQQCFRDVVLPFKEHFIVDLHLPIEKAVSKHHRYYARKAFEKIHVEKLRDAVLFIDEWESLYATLIARYNLAGIKAFSKAAFAKQLSVPGIVTFRASFEGTTVGAHLWYVVGNIAYSHLAAFSPLGYDLMSSYALYWYAIGYFRERVRWLDIGAGAGTESNGSDGLSWFKRGWSTGSRVTYFCGRIFDNVRYTQITKARQLSGTTYFPAYREGEFG